VASTQFQSVNARLAFPCFDQPDRKAKFTLALAHDPQFSAIANMPLESTTPGGLE
jgi:aminopeptidase N